MCKKFHILIMCWIILQTCLGGPSACPTERSPELVRSTCSLFLLLSSRHFLQQGADIYNNSIPVPCSRVADPQLFIADPDLVKKKKNSMRIRIQPKISARIRVYAFGMVTTMI
jgi:hypothetical protein